MSKRTFLIVLLILAAVSLGWAADFDAGMDAYRKGDYKAALQEFKPLAEQGNVDAQYRLGLMYDNGEGVPQDVTEAARWFRKAAEQGHVGAQDHLTAAPSAESVVTLEPESKPEPAPSRSDVHQIPLAIPPLPEQPSAEISIPLAIPPLPEQPSAEIPIEPATQEVLPLQATPESLTPPTAPIAEIPPLSIPKPEENISVIETQPTPPIAPETPILPTPSVQAPDTAVIITPEPQIQAQSNAKPSPKSKSKRKIRPRSGSFRVQLASIRARSLAENLWRDLQRKHRNLLDGLSLTVQRAELKQGVFHRLQAGPLSRTEAESICAALKRRNQGCLVVNR